MDATDRPTLAGFPRRHPWLTAFTLPGIGIVVLLLLWDWNWFRRPIERRVTAQTGRSFHIDGNLDVDLGRTATIRADRLRFGNAAWARGTEMATTKRLEFDLRLWPLLPLLRGDAQVQRIVLVEPTLHLQRDAKGLGNWTLREGSENRLEFRNVRIEDGRLVYYEPSRKTEIDVSVDSKALRDGDAEPPIAVRGGGLWSGNRFTLQGTTESPLELRDAERPYRIDARAQAGATRTHARGTLLDPLRFRDFDLKLALAGKNLSDLYPLIGVAIPDTPPYALDGRLTRTREGRKTTWHYDRFTGKVGDSDLGGDAAVTTGGPRPFLKADLLSKRLDIDDLAGFIGAAPQPTESSNPELRAEAARNLASDRLLPDKPYRLDRLRAMDADVRLKARRIDALKLPLDDMDAHLLLDDGLLRLQPLDFGVAAGNIRSTIRMDARESPIRTQAAIRAKGLDLARLLPTLELGKTAIGKVGGEVDFNGTGNSIAAMLGSADGSASADMGEGRISKLLMEYAGLDLAGILRIKLTRDRQIPIRCAYGEFVVKDGVMTSRRMAFDTSETLLLGSGTIDLGEEALDLTIHPKTKDFSPLSLRSPLYVQGSFKHPDFRPDYARIGLRAGAAAALATVTAPAAALVATTDLGRSKDVPCGTEPAPAKAAKNPG